MKLTRLTRLSATALFLIAMIPAAHADYICNSGDTCVAQTLQGVILGGGGSGDGTFDDANLFNVNGGSLLGQTITLNFGYDVTTILNDGGSLEQSPGYFGEISDNSGSSEAFFTATIGGTTFSVASDGSVLAAMETAAVSNYYNQYVLDVAGDAGEADFTVYNVNYALQGLTYDPTSNSQIGLFIADSQSFFQLFLYNSSGQDDALAGSITLQPAVISVTPEPADWTLTAMGLGGLALIGFRTRRGGSVPAR